MGIEKGDTKSNSVNLNDEVFLKNLGRLLRQMRKAAGFTTIRSFTDTIDVSYSQYQGYESGRNITITTLKRILKEFNLDVEEWLNLNFHPEQELDSKTVLKIKQARIEQLIEQVKFKDNLSDVNQISIKEATRYVEILIYCSAPKSRKEILVNLLKMDDSVNTFKRVAGKLLQYNWLSLTDNKKRNNPNQKYYTTFLGKKLLKLANS